MLERTTVFVDTSYLLASFYNSWEIGARGQLELDLPAVVNTLNRMITTQISQPVHRQLWYDGIPESGPHRYQRSLRTIDNVQLRAGQLIVWGERRTQKAVDTRLVADMVMHAVRQTSSDIVLVSGDADMLPGVEEAVNLGLRVHLYGFGWDSMSSALRHACDTTTILDPREDFADCMQLQVLEGPIPPSVRVNHVSSAEEHEATHAEREDAPHAAAETTRDSHPREQEPPEPTASMEDADTPPPAPSTPTPADLARASRPTAPHSTVMANDNDSEEVADSLTLGEPDSDDEEDEDRGDDRAEAGKSRPSPSMMAPRRKLRSRYVPLPSEVWSTNGSQSPFDVGQQYASWWFDNAATDTQRDQAHLLSGGGLPPEIDRPLLQFACETLHEYTLTESQRVSLRDGFHAGIRTVLLRGDFN